MAKRYNKLKPKLSPLPFIIMGVIIVVMVIFIIWMSPNAQKKLANDYNSRGADLDSNHALVEIKYSQYEKKLANKENFVLYIGSPNCQSCIGEIKYYDLYFQDLGLKDSLKKVYYLNANKLSEDQKKTLQQTLFLQELTTPQLLYYHQGVFSTSRADQAYKSHGVTAPGEIKAFYEAVLARQ